ncbi:uncharacterized protein LOC124273665 [Haliotis rubra]|uniref:uncharacterized protein LOC124273665 n=1 Tax=Haliotis rubra TaxID=36100 RepID=UPI001EE5539A|nr:uncharacterized protein LOC124273665 [Haliotis rubra]
MDLTSGGGSLGSGCGLDFLPGNCDVCKQKHVRVTSFHCRSHFYCRSCLEFAPKFRRRKDFSCPTCSDHNKHRTSDNLQEVDKFMRTQTSGQTNEDFEEVVFGVGGSNIVFWNGVPECSDEESDLTGNNDEWENLLRTVSRDTQQQPTSGVEQPIERQKSYVIQKIPHTFEGNAPMTRFITKPGIMGMAPATSYLQLKLPTAEPSDSSKSSSISSSEGSSGSASNNSQTSSMEIKLSTTSSRLRGHKDHIARSHSSFCSSSVSNDNDDGDRLEVKGSVVGSRYSRQAQWLFNASPEDYPDDARKKRPNTPVSSRTSVSPEGHRRSGSGTSFERWMEELGQVEGPLFKDSDTPFSSEEKLPEVEKDDFWDM